MKGRNKILYKLLKSGRYYTLLEIQALTGHDAATASAGIRDFRKPEYGANTVEKKYLGEGVYKYKLILNPDNNILKEKYEELKRNTVMI